ncbi:MAG: lipocalin-like domain-containing protein [Bacteroidales bacterium]|nr:lipocalin-like domain-containing protein [Bacteroidales bacterium]MDD4821515.1 lipocalin-like domain-containing protein [Bacteroidales bacterium]
MRKLIITGLAALLLVMVIACGKNPENGKLDGMWQLTEIESANGVSISKKSDRIYYSFQLHVVELRRIGYDEYRGHFDYTGDSLSLHMRDYMIKDTCSFFGLKTMNDQFAIEVLTGSNMMLRRDNVRLKFRKF